MGLVVDYPAGTSAQRVIALEAARAVFDAAGLEPWVSFAALHALEAWDDRGFDEAFALTDGQEEALAVLGRAEIAASDSLHLASRERASLQLWYELDGAGADAGARLTSGRLSSGDSAASMESFSPVQRVRN